VSKRQVIDHRTSWTFLITNNSSDESLKDLSAFEQRSR